MTVSELSFEQMEELKQNYLINHLLEVEDRSASYEEIASAAEIVPDNITGVIASAAFNKKTGSNSVKKLNGILKTGHVMRNILYYIKTGKIYLSKMIILKNIVLVLFVTSDRFMVFLSISPA